MTVWAVSAKTNIPSELIEAELWNVQANRIQFLP
jgi:hypothetical protein